MRGSARRVRRAKINLIGKLCIGEPYNKCGDGRRVWMRAEIGGRDRVRTYDLVVATTRSPS